MPRLKPTPEPQPETPEKQRWRAWCWLHEAIVERGGVVVSPRLNPVIRFECAADNTELPNWISERFRLRHAGTAERFRPAVEVRKINARGDTARCDHMMPVTMAIYEFSAFA
jgi:hypothetical protein